MQQIVCPKCHKPVSGRPRVCGYCGTSLVQEYFSDHTKKAESPAREQLPESTAGGVAATVLGIFAAFSVLAALAMQVMLLFRAEGAVPAQLDLFWWLRIAAMAMLAPIFLVQQIALRGVRYSIVFDAAWLFVAAFGLGLTMQGFLGQGGAAFYGENAIAYLTALGGSLALVSCVFGIFSVKKR